MNERLNSDARWLERTKHDFDAAVEATDVAVAASLRAARARALDDAGRHSWRVPATLWLPAVAIAGLAAVVLVPRIDSVGPGEPRDIGTVAAADLELLLGEEEFDMFAELEFYEWLEMQDGPAADDGTEDGVG